MNISALKSVSEYSEAATEFDSRSLDVFKAMIVANDQKSEIDSLLFEIVNRLSDQVRAIRESAKKGGSLEFDSTYFRLNKKYDSLYSELTQQRGLTDLGINELSKEIEFAKTQSTEFKESAEKRYTDILDPLWTMVISNVSLTAALIVGLILALINRKSQ